MPIIEVPLIEQTAESVSRPASSMTTDNMYAEIFDEGGRTRAAFFPMPGTTALFTAGNGPERGTGAVFGDYSYVVSGDSLYQIDSLFAATLVGTLNTTSGPVYMAPGAAYLMLVDGEYGYTYDGTTFAQITDSDFPTKPTSVDWVDNYWVIHSGGTGQFYWSLSDPTSWTALDTATAERYPDDATRVSVIAGKLAIIGEYSTEIYANTGDADAPFQRYPNLAPEYGTPAPASVAKAPGVIFMLAESRSGGYQIVKLASDQPVPISSDTMNKEITGLSSVTNANAFCYTYSGHLFYQISFPTSGKVYCYDDHTGLWQRRTTGSGRNRAMGHVYFNGKHIFGDYASNQFYALDDTVYTDNGTFVERSRTMGVVLDPKGRQFAVRSFEVDIETGVGLTSGQGSDPIIQMSYSIDGGRNWSNWLDATMGKVGDYQRIVRWNNLGLCRSFIPRVRVTDPVRTVFFSARANIEPGMH